MSSIEVPPKLTLPPEPQMTPGVFWRPSRMFVDELAGYLGRRSVLEIFAGNGYLAAWLTRAGVPVTATTQWSGHDAHHFGLFHDVLELEAREAVVRYRDDHDVLLVCWPVASESTMAAVRAWPRSKPVVYVGEVTSYSKGHLAGCASDAFFEAIEVVHRFASYKGNIMEAAFVCRLKDETISTGARRP